MPNRILKESIKSDESIDELSWFEEVLYYRLIVTADDYGCMDGRTILLRNELFPLKENVTKKAVEDAISHLVSVGLLRRYEVNGKPYMFFPTWEKHQRVRNQNRKYPEPTEECFAGDCPSNDGQMTAACLSESNPIQSESNPNPNPNPTHAGAGGEAFDRFWSVYPKKVGKMDAARAFRKIYSKVSVDELIAAVERQEKSEQWTKEGGRYIPNPATWLNQGRWEDELAPARGNGYQRHDQELSPAMATAVKRMMEEMEEE